MCSLSRVLAPRTPYYYQVVAENATGTSYGSVETFTTFDAPLVTTGAAQGTTRTTAAISGTVSPGGLHTRYQFVYVDAAHYNAGAGECPQGQPCAYGESAKMTPSEVLGASDYATHPVGPQGLEELTPGTTYHYALIVSNSEGARVGSDQTFTTLPATPPSASTGETSGVSQTSATLSGTADLHGLPGRLSFEVGISPEGGSLEPASASGAGITFSFGGYLQPETTYYYRTVATNADGTATGEWRSFTTGSFPSPFAAPTSAIPLLSYTTLAEIEAKEAKNNKGTTVGKPLTNKQKLTKALKACHKSKSSAKRTKCEKQAHTKYGPKKHKK